MNLPVIPRRIAQVIENGRGYFKYNHNVLAYTLHSYNFDKDDAKQLTQDQVNLITRAVYEGYAVSKKKPKNK